MNYLEGRKAGDKKDLKWAEYFDVVIVGGNKPAFLEDDRYVIYYSMIVWLCHCVYEDLVQRWLG